MCDTWDRSWRSGMSDFRYDVALSFAGEDRTVAEAIAARLDAAGYSVFYDFYEADQLWGEDLPAELGNVYLNDARFCLMLVSQHYVRKVWTNHERQYAIARLLKDRSGYILPL